eukprot:12335035-Karenia_brevis.AAC.1
MNSKVDRTVLHIAAVLDVECAPMSIFALSASQGSAGFASAEALVVHSSTAFSARYGIGASVTLE